MNKLINNNNSNQRNGSGIKHLAYKVESTKLFQEEDMALNSASAVLNKFRGWLGDTFAGDVLHINAVTCKWETMSEKGYRTIVCIVFTKVKLRKTLEKILGDEFTVAPVD
jgi:hypothetical protein